MLQAQWLYQPPSWHPRPRRGLPLSPPAAGTLALNSAGYEIGDGNSPATMAVEASVAFDVAVYPTSQWPMTAATLTQTAQTTNASGRLANIVNVALVAGTSYRVCLRRTTDGGVWTFTITAT